jgi:3-methyl-2-oxobutanoate hydroxymethyltransferase
MANEPEAAAEEPRREKVTLRTLEEMKARREPVCWLTAYDYPTALVMDRAGVDMILVGDSAGMTMLGLETTLPVTMDQMITFTSAVCRAVQYAFVVGDMPYMSYQVSTEEAIRNAGRFMAECGTDAVKIEGGARMAPAIEAITNAGIPVLAQEVSREYSSQVRLRCAQAAMVVAKHPHCGNGVRELAGPRGLRVRVVFRA